MANRTELEQALKEGCTVDVYGTSYKSVKELPPDRGDTPIEGTVTYDREGRLTREGMELAIKRGGSVLHEDRPVNDLEALPTAADLAKHDAVRSQRERQHLLDRRAQLDAELAKLEQPREERFTQAPAQQQEEDTPERSPRPAPLPAFRPPEGQDVRGSEEDTPERRRGRKGG
jgi:hypothetical protein